MQHLSRGVQQGNGHSPPSLFWQLRQFRQFGELRHFGQMQHLIGGVQQGTGHSPPRWLWQLGEFLKFWQLRHFWQMRHLIGGVQGRGHSPPLIRRPAPPQRATNGRKVKPTSLCMKGTEWCQYLVMSSRNNADNLLKYLGIFKHKFSWLTRCPQPTWEVVFNLQLLEIIFEEFGVKSWNGCLIASNKT